jgi:hypothetical protein
MSWLFPWFLFAHVLGAIAAFGPSYSMPIIGRMGGAEPQHANFAPAVSLASQAADLAARRAPGRHRGRPHRTSNRDLTKSCGSGRDRSCTPSPSAIRHRSTPTVKKIIEMTSTPPPPRPGAAPSGPPPAHGPHPALQLGGMFLAGLIAVIVFLMVVKPF